MGNTKSDKRIKYAAVLRRASDGVERTYVSDFPVWDSSNDPMTGVEFYFKDGNASCDCNRHLFFERVVNPALMSHDVKPNPCGDDIRYELVSLTQIGEPYTEEPTAP